MMNFEEYEKLAMRTAYSNHHTDNPLYAIACIAGEAGELVNKVKKVYRDQDGEFKPENVDEFIDEAGDILWYLVFACKMYKIHLHQIASFNIKKLEKRYNLDRQT